MKQGKLKGAFGTLAPHDIEVLKSLSYIAHIVRVLVNVLNKVPKSNKIVSGLGILTSCFWLFWLVYNFKAHSEFEVWLSVLSYPPMIISCIAFLYFDRAKDLGVVVEIFKVLMMAWMFVNGAIYGTFDFFFAHWVSPYIEAWARSCDILNVASAVFLFLQTPLATNRKN